MSTRIEPTEREYNIRAKVKFVNLDVKDHDRQYKRKIVILHPKTSTEQALFYSAWLPEVAEEYFELTGIIRSGIATPVRLAILKAKSGVSQSPYLMIMNKGIEEEFINQRFEGKVIDLTIMAEGNDELADAARDSGGSFDLIHGQETL